MNSTASVSATAAPRAEFPLLQTSMSGQPLVYLDSAATTQKPAAVLAAMDAYYARDNANVHRGLYDLARRSTDAFEHARARVAQFIHAPSPADVIWVRGTTEAINLVASAWGGAELRAGDEIVLSVLEHHSNIVPWQLIAQRTGAVIRWLDIDEQGRLRVDELDELLCERTRIVCIGHISNALGTINPVAEIAAKAHAAGALVLVDGAQGAPHLPVDVQALGCDFYALSGHKMLGPMGIGALYGRTDILAGMQPYQGGGEMIDRVTTTGSTWAQPPHRFEAGTPNVAGAVGIAAACDYIAAIGHHAIREHELELTKYGMEILQGIDGLTLFGPHDPAERIAVFSFTLAGVHPHDIATVLDAEGIAVRAGHHCAHPLMQRLGVPATARASAYVYNAAEDFDRLAHGLRSAQSIFGS